MSGINQILRWDDLRIDTNNIKLDATNPPSETAYKGGFVLEFPDNANKKIYFSVQFPHSRSVGSDVHFHLHYVIDTNGSGAGAENVKWIFTHSWADIGSAFPTETTVNTGTTKDVQNINADVHVIHEIAEIDGTGKDISSMMLCSLERDTTVADNYTGHIYLMEVDFHVQLDSLGSIIEFNK